MATDILLILLKTNLAGSAAILLLFALRKPARRWFGAKSAYTLWMLAPLAAAAVLLPARFAPIVASVHVRPPAAAVTVLPETLTPNVAALPARPVAPSLASNSLSPSEGLLAVWLIGVSAGLAFVAVQQRRFLRAVGLLRRGDGGRIFISANAGVGPALVGVLFPRIILPADFESRFSSEEQEVVLAHERAHLARQDPRMNGLLALAQCLAWFNPLLHVAAYFIRLDQELACDAAVVERRPNQRRCYAHALLKSQMMATRLPLGCHWPARSLHPFEERISMLNQSSPNTVRRIAGLASLIALCFGGGVAAWASQPPRSAEMAAAPHAPASSATTAGSLKLANAATATPAPSAPAEIAGDDASGDWIGGLPAWDVRLALHVHKVAGAYQGTIDSPDQGGYGIPVNRFTVSGGELSFSIDNLSASYDAKWDAADQQWAGQWSQAGFKFPMALHRGVYAPAPVIAGLDGDWDARMVPDRPVTIHILTGEHGTIARVDSPAQLKFGVPVNAIIRQGNHVVLVQKALDATWTGDLSADGQTITGIFTLRGGTQSFVLTRRSSVQQPPAAPVAPQAVLSGTWDFAGEIESSAGATVIARPECIFQQAGEHLTGTCKGPNSLGTATGTIHGQTVSIRWDATAFSSIGGSGAATFDGTLGADGVIRGSMTFGGLGGGSFTATRP